MDPSEYGLTNQDFGLPDENGGTVTDPSAMLMLASQGAALEHQMRSRAQVSPVPRPRPPMPAPQPVSAQPASNSALDAIERRLNLASYYRALLEQPIFETDDEDALLVED